MAQLWCRNIIVNIRIRELTIVKMVRSQTGIWREIIPPHVYSYGTRSPTLQTDCDSVMVQLEFQLQWIKANNQITRPCLSLLFVFIIEWLIATFQFEYSVFSHSDSSWAIVYWITTLTFCLQYADSSRCVFWIHLHEIKNAFKIPPASHCKTVEMGFNKSNSHFRSLPILLCHAPIPTFKILVWVLTFNFFHFQISLSSPHNCKLMTWAYRKKKEETQYVLRITIIILILPNKSRHSFPKTWSLFFFVSQMKCNKRHAATWASQNIVR